MDRIRLKSEAGLDVSKSALICLSRLCHRAVRRGKRRAWRSYTTLLGRLLSHNGRTAHGSEAGDQPDFQTYDPLRARACFQLSSLLGQLKLGDDVFVKGSIRSISLF